MLERFKKNPEIEFFTKIDTLPEVVPIAPGGKTMPAWWKQPPATIPNTDPRLNTGTAKVCPAFREFYSSAYIVPLWCDLVFDYNHGEPRARTSAPDLISVGFHSPPQFLNYAPTNSGVEMII